jgi:Holliday junction resolvase RusA-like endonuclease
MMAATGAGAGTGAGAVDVWMRFHFATNKAERIGQPHTFKPDGDNLAKLVLDVMERAGALPRGDQAVSSLTVEKVWATWGGVVVRMAPAVALGGARGGEAGEAAPGWLAEGN